jgi:hypothetical protein
VTGARVVAEEKLGTSEDIHQLGDIQWWKNGIHDWRKAESVSVRIGDERKVKIELPSQALNDVCEVLLGPASHWDARAGMKTHEGFLQTGEKIINSGRAILRVLKARFRDFHPGKTERTPNVTPVFDAVLLGP